MDNFNGVHFMMPTPFDQNGSVDESSIEHLVKLAIEAKCHGIVCLGVTGEASRLTDSERYQVSRRVIKEVNGFLPVTIGASALGNDVSIQRCVEAESIGASAVLVAPIPLTKPNPDSILSHYEQISASIKLPIIVQDFPEQTNVFMDPPFIKTLSKKVAQISGLKLEDPPTPPKITAVRKIVSEEFQIFGGLGGMFLYEELMRGACGTMTGFSYPEVLVSIYNNVLSGASEKARGIFHHYLPIIRYEHQQGIGIAIRKAILKKRGALANATPRLPQLEIDETTQRELYNLLDSLDL